MIAHRMCLLALASSAIAQSTFDTTKITLEDPEIAAVPACAPLRSGSGPVPTPDNPSTFLAYPEFSDSANAATAPAGYSSTFTNLQASVLGPEGLLARNYLTSYDVPGCASLCNAKDGCTGFNIFYERAPSVNPAVNCSNPASTTLIKCNLWSQDKPVNTENAKNKGQFRQSFHVVMAGSNGYTASSTPNPGPSPIDGFTGTSLGNAAIRAPDRDCNNVYTYMGYRSFSDGSFTDFNRCAQTCNDVSAYNQRHAPTTGSPRLCKYFNSYVQVKNGNRVRQVCAFYTRPWPATYNTNRGYTSPSNGTVYTIADSYAYAANDGVVCLPGSSTTPKPSSTAFASASPTPPPVTLALIEFE